MDKEKIRIGFFLDAFYVPAWVFSAIQRLKQNDFIEICLIIFKEPADERKSLNQSLPKAGSPILYRLFNWIDEKIFLREPNAEKPTNLQELLPHTPAIWISSEHFDHEDLEQISNFKPHILVNFEWKSIPGEIIECAKYGVWFYQHRDPGLRQAGPVGFWEVVENRTVTGVSLVCFHNSFQNPVILYQASFSTYPLSPARNRNRVLWASAPILPRQVEQFYHLGEKAFFSRKEEAHFEFSSVKEDVPGNFAFLSSIFHIIVKLFHESYTRLYFIHQWYLLFDWFVDLNLPFQQFIKMIPPKDRFWADPMLIEHNNHYYLFIEEYIYRTKKAHISVIEMIDPGNWSDPICVLEKDYHLSYPYIFEWNGSYYMVPESAANNSIDLYQCVSFPDQWEFKHRLMENVKAVDTSLLYFAGKWWMFTAIAENTAAFPEVELFLFYADDLFSDQWISHPKNPISSNVKGTRPAGKIICSDGKFIRPSQDCTKSYGYGFLLNEIVNLSPTDYEEQEIMSVKPDWDKDVLATHTYARQGSLTVIDGLRLISRQL
jgi:hypothetical protein